MACRGTNTGFNGCECLRLKPGMEFAAAFLETRRYAGYLGASTEWSKWEGMTFDPLRQQLYVSISVVRNGAENSSTRGVADPRYDQCGPNAVRVKVCERGGGPGSTCGRRAGMAITPSMHCVPA